jgi:ATP/maltotriose-dependent transcriptional regulator MalT
VDRRAWHLAAAAVGPDDAASSALAQAGARSRERSAYATASAAYERAGRLAADPERRARLFAEAGAAAWDAGQAERALALIDEAMQCAGDPATVSKLNELAGYIACRRGPVMRGHAILTAAARDAEPERAVSMLVEAVSACFYAGEGRELLDTAELALARLPDTASAHARFLALAAVGAARVVSGDASNGTHALREAILIAEANPALSDNLDTLPWLAMAPIFLRERQAGRALIDQALRAARARAALGVLPYVLHLIARDQATTDKWTLAEASYQHAVGLARESGQHTQLAFALSGLAWLLARRGREDDCRAAARESLALSSELGMRLAEVWSTAALGELELGLGHPEAAVAALEPQRVRLHDMQITDVDLSPAAELVDAYLRLGREHDARRIADEFMAAAVAKGQPWSLARAWRCRGLTAEGAASAAHFERALAIHGQTPDAFELARTQLAYGESLRRARNRVLAREHLRAALATFERLEARPWAERAHAELAASGETLRRRDAESRDELTPQELQVALLLAAGRTTRETAATLFLSPKTVEYHLRHVYLKLGVNSREALAVAMSRDQVAGAASAQAPAMVD